MPFGPNCEYEDMQACERANRDRNDPAAYCAAIMRRTEEHCMGNHTSTAARSLPLAITPFDGRPPPRMVRRPIARANPSWYRIQAKAGVEQTTLIDIYDEISWFGISAQEFVKDLRGVDTPRIELHINSPGGDVFDAVAIYNALRQHDAQVHVIVDSLAASAASFIAMAGDRITAMANAMMMIHDPLGMVIGNAADMRELADLLDKHGDNIASIYAARAGGDVATWRERMGAETWYLADEAYKAGLVDEVDETDGRPVEDSWDLSVFHRAEQTQVAATLMDNGLTPDQASVVVDTACPTHHTATTDQGSWDKGPNEKRLPSPMSVATAKKAYGYYDSAKVENGQVVKDACKLLHHVVSADGTPGAAHLGGVRAALSRLGQSGTNIPDAERPAIESHLHAHMNDAPGDHADQQPNSSSVSSVPSDYLGQTAAWYLPAPQEGKEHSSCL